MKPRILAPLAIAALLLTGCASTPATSGAELGSPAQTPPTEQAQPAEPLDLTGEWQQTNSKSADSYQAATIVGDTITVNWVNEAESTTALYWVGTYEAPTDATDSFTWTSAGDVSQMQSALLASGDETKTFSYSSGTLTYELTAMGVTMTVEMAKK
jgi:flagellar basal body L-ring protein FlgH